MRIESVACHSAFCYATMKRFAINFHKSNRNTRNASVNLEIGVMPYGFFNWRNFLGFKWQILIGTVGHTVYMNLISFLTS